MDYRKRENFYTVKEVVEHNTSKDILKEEDRNYQFDFGGIPDMIRDHSGKISIISDYDMERSKRQSKLSIQMIQAMYL